MNSRTNSFREMRVSLFFEMNIWRWKEESFNDAPMLNRKNWWTIWSLRLIISTKARQQIIKARTNKNHSCTLHWYHLKSLWNSYRRALTESVPMGVEDVYVESYVKPDVLKLVANVWFFIYRTLESRKIITQLFSWAYESIVSLLQVRTSTSLGLIQIHHRTQLMNDPLTSWSFCSSKLLQKLFTTSSVKWYIKYFMSIKCNNKWSLKV